MDKVKTVIDAVKRFQHIGCNVTGVVYHPEHNTYSMTFAPDVAVSDGWQLVCTADEFNTCIDELSKAEWMSKPKAVYTQAMSDSGDIYHIDGLYIGICNSLIQLKEICNGEFIGIDASGNHYQDSWLISIDQSKVFPSANFGTTTRPPIKLEDGKVYSFDIKGEVCLGFYRESDRAFFCTDKYECMVCDSDFSGCKNIKPLGVIDG